MGSSYLLGMYQVGTLVCRPAVVVLGPMNWTRPGIYFWLLKSCTVCHLSRKERVAHFCENAKIEREINAMSSFFFPLPFFAVQIWQNNIKSSWILFVTYYGWQYKTLVNSVYACNKKWWEKNSYKWKFGYNIHGKLLKSPTKLHYGGLNPRMWPLQYNVSCKPIS